MNDSETLVDFMEKQISDELMVHYRGHKEQCTGFIPSCSQRPSWDCMPRILVLTHYPHPFKNEKRGKITCLWPEDIRNVHRNAVFVAENWESRLFHERLLLILAEIANLTPGTGKTFTPSISDSGLETFVDSHMVVASFVPFRSTSNDKAWIAERERFAKEQFWGPIFEKWRPEVIIALGNRPFYGMADLLQSRFSLSRLDAGLESASISHSPTADLHGPCKGSFRSWACPLRSGETMHLLGIPSPAAPGHYGYPGPTAAASARAPVQDFLKERLEPLL